jgi:hypothetical protein
MLTTAGLAARPDCGRGLWMTWPDGQAHPDLGLRTIPGSQLSVEDEHRDRLWLDLETSLQQGQGEWIASELIARSAARA